MWEFFPSGGPPPLPPVWEPHVCEKKLWFILHFRTLGTFLVFTKMFTFGWYCGLQKWERVTPPPPASEKFPLYPVLLYFFYRMSTRGPKTKLT